MSSKLVVAGTGGTVIFAWFNLINNFSHANHTNTSLVVFATILAILSAVFVWSLLAFIENLIYDAKNSKDNDS